MNELHSALLEAASLHGSAYTTLRAEILALHAPADIAAAAQAVRVDDAAAPVLAAFALWAADAEACHAVARYARGDLGERCLFAGGEWPVEERAARIEALGARVVPRVVELLVHSDEGAGAVGGLALIAALDGLEAPASRSVLELVARTHPHADVRRAALEMLVRAHPAHGATLALALAEDGAAPAELRRRAIHLLGRVRLREAGRVLLDLVAAADTPPSLRADAVEALGMSGDPAARDLLRDLAATTADARVLDASLWALVDLRAVDALALMDEVALHHEDAAIRASARRAGTVLRQRDREVT
jgi:hypothetical protein